jgi:hypothetical protein
MTEAEMNSLLQGPPTEDPPKPIEKMSDFERIIKSIKPGKELGQRCTVVGCWGTRGWHSVTEVKAHDGSKRTTVNLCCGKVGKSDFAVIDERISLIETSVEQLAAETRNQFEVLRVLVKAEGRPRLVKWRSAYRLWKLQREVKRYEKGK